MADPEVDEPADVVLTVEAIRKNLEDVDLSAPDAYFAEADGTLVGSNLGVYRQAVSKELGRRRAEAEKAAAVSEPQAEPSTDDVAEEAAPDAAAVDEPVDEPEQVEEPEDEPEPSPEDLVDEEPVEEPDELEDVVEEPDLLDPDVDAETDEIDFDDDLVIE